MVSENGSKVTCRAFPKDPAHPPTSEVMERLIKNDFNIDAFQVESGRLDEVFRTVTNSDAVEGEK